MRKILIDKISKYFILKEREIGEYSKIDKRGMHFRISAYEIYSGEEKLVGNLCEIEMKAVLGLMKMHSEVFTPIGIDAPLFSKDSIKVASTTTLILELYDTMIGQWSAKALEDVKDTGKDIPEYDPGIHWYDTIRLPCSSFKKGKKIQEKLEAYEENYIEVYTNQMIQMPSADPKEKKKKTSAYVEQLIANGGPAVNQFKKIMGEEKAILFLRQIMFSTI